MSGSECDLLVHNGLVLDRRQTPEPGLSPPPMIGALDPGHDREPQLFSCGPAAPVKDVVLQQTEKRFHRCIVTGSTNSAHRPDHVVLVKRTPELPTPKLRSSVRVQDATGYVPSTHDCIVQCSDCE